MPCRVGITTNPEEHKAHWVREHPQMRNWRADGPYSSRAKAQEREDLLKARYNCAAHPVGADPAHPSARWWVYKFDY